jgi:hypothetical protein
MPTDIIRRQESPPTMLNPGTPSDSAVVLFRPFHGHGVQDEHGADGH